MRFDDMGLYSSVVCARTADVPIEVASHALGMNIKHPKLVRLLRIPFVVRAETTLVADDMFRLAGKSVFNWHTAVMPVLYNSFASYEVKLLMNRLASPTTFAMGGLVPAESERVFKTKPSEPIVEHVWNAAELQAMQAILQEFEDSRQKVMAKPGRLDPIHVPMRPGLLCRQGEIYLRGADYEEYAQRVHLNHYERKVVSLPDASSPHTMIGSFRSVVAARSVNLERAELFLFDSECRLEHRSHAHLIFPAKTACYVYNQVDLRGAVRD